MHKNKSNSMVAANAGRAWRFLRLALFWTRKGGILNLKSRLVLAKHLIKTIKNSTHRHHHQAGAIGYGERELSFDDTPVIHVKMHRPSSLRFKMPNIPCINPPHYDFDPEYYCGDDPDDMYNYHDNGYDDEEEEEEVFCEEMNSPSTTGSDEGIDLKAEEFIAKFYQQIKLQRQISYLQYHEMISRGAN